MLRATILTTCTLLISACAVSIDHTDVFAVRDAHLPVSRLALPETLPRGKIEEVAVEASDRVFYGYKISARKPTRAVLFFSGNGYGASSAIGRIGEAFADEVTDVYVVSYAVPPESPPRVAQVYALAERLAQKAMEGGIPRQHVAAVGHSLGGWIALHLATTPLVGCAVVAGTGTTAEQTAKRLLPDLVSATLPLRLTEDVLLLNNIEQARVSRVPVLVVASERDKTMPVVESRMIFEALPEWNRQLHISRTAAHNGYFRDAVVIDQMREFIRGSCGVATGNAARDAGVNV